MIIILDFIPSQMVLVFFSFISSPLDVQIPIQQVFCRVFQNQQIQPHQYHPIHPWYPHKCPIQGDDWTKCSSWDREPILTPLIVPYLYSGLNLCCFALSKDFYKHLHFPSEVRHTGSRSNRNLYQLQQGNDHCRWHHPGQQRSWLLFSWLRSLEHNRFCIQHCVYDQLFSGSTKCTLLSLGSDRGKCPPNHLIKECRSFFSTEGFGLELILFIKLTRNLSKCLFMCARRLYLLLWWHSSSFLASLRILWNLHRIPICIWVFRDLCLS